MIYQQNGKWTLCVFDDISTKEQRHFVFLNNIATTPTQAYRLFAFFDDISLKAQHGFVFLLICHQKRKMFMYNVVDIS